MPAAVCRLSELQLQSSLREPRKVLRNSVFDCAVLFLFLRFTSRIDWCCPVHWHRIRSCVLPMAS